MLGRGQVMTLTRGEPVFLTGAYFEWRFYITNFYRAGHGGLNITLRDKAGNSLADLCLYFEDTPVIEQVAAIAMHLACGEEQELLTTGNVSNVTSAGAIHPLIAERMKKRSDDAEDLEQFIGRATRNPRIRRFINEELHRELKMEYVDTMAQRYLEPLIDRVWGVDGVRLRGFSAQTT